MGLHLESILWSDGFLKEVFELKPSLSKYNEIGDVSLVLEYLRHLPRLENMSLKDHSRKLATRLCLLTGQRCQTIHKFDIKYIQFFSRSLFCECKRKTETYTTRATSGPN